MLSLTDTSIASEYLFGPFEVTIGTRSHAATQVSPVRRYASIDCVADGSTWQTAFTVTAPTRGSASYRLIARTVGVGGRATASELVSEVLISRYDSTVTGSVSVAKDGTSADGVVDNVRVTASGTDALIQVQLSLWTGDPTFPVECYLIPNNQDDAKHIA